MSLVTKLLGETGADLGWAADAAVSRGFNELLTARRLILYSDGRPQQVGGVETRRRPEAPAVPRADPAPAAATAEEVAARVAKKAARNKKKNKARMSDASACARLGNLGGVSRAAVMLPLPLIWRGRRLLQSQLRHNRRLWTPPHWRGRRAEERCR